MWARTTATADAAVGGGGDLEGQTCCLKILLAAQNSDLFCKFLLFLGTQHKSVGPADLPENLTEDFTNGGTIGIHVLFSAAGGGKFHHCCMSLDAELYTACLVC